MTRYAIERSHKHIDKWVQKQKLDKDWRPKNYYERVCEGWRTSLPDPEKDLDELLREIFVNYYHAVEEHITYEIDEIIDFHEPMEVLDVDSDSVSMVSHDARWLLSSFQEDHFLPRFTTSVRVQKPKKEMRESASEEASGEKSVKPPNGRYKSTSHKALRKSIIRNVSPHWITEMWLLLCTGHDRSRCNIIPWDYRK
jgi:hypothetical protein